MVDLGIDYSFNVYIDNGGNLAFVEGREAFEQRIIIQLTDRYYDIVGSTDPEEIIERLRLKAERVADIDPNIERMPTFDISFSSEEYKTVEVTIVYDTGDITEFTI